MPSLSAYAKKVKSQADGFRKRSEAQRRKAGKALEQLAVRLSEATNDFNKYEKEAVTIREQLAQIPTPADGEALVARLERTLSFMATAQAELLTAQVGLMEEKSIAETAQKQLDQANRKLTGADEVSAKANKLDEELITLKNAFDTDPVKTLIADATAALSGPILTKAESRIKADIPDALRNRAKERRAAEVKWQKAVTDHTTLASEKLSGLLEEDRGLAEKVKHRYIQFQAAQDKLRGVVIRGSEQYEQAVALLKRAGDIEVSPLTPDQVRRINGLKGDGTEDEALKADRQKALDEEDKVLGKQTERATKAAAYEGARLDAMGNKKDPALDAGVKAAKEAFDTATDEYEKGLGEWQKSVVEVKKKAAGVRELDEKFRIAVQDAVREKKDPATDPTVTAAKEKLEKARSEQETVESEYPKSNHGVLHAWQAAVPDPTWRLFEEVERVKAVLENLKGLKANELVSDWTKAEEAYVEALTDADDSVTALDRLDLEQARQTARVKALEQVAARRRFSAMRGDT